MVELRVVYWPAEEAPVAALRGRPARSWEPRRRDQMAAYRQYVEEGLPRDIDDPSAALEAWSILGSDSFVDRIRRTYLLKRDADAREEPELVHLQSSLTAAHVVSVVAAVRGVSNEAIP